MPKPGNDNRQRGGPGRVSARGRQCPICAKPVEVAYRPFCSRRCADVDLSRWLGGVYAIPVNPALEENDPPPPHEPDGQEE